MQSPAFCQIADERLRDASIAAKAAAIEAVEKSLVEGSFTGNEGEEDDWLGSSDFVQLNIGDESPMVRVSLSQRGPHALLVAGMWHA